MMRRVIRISNPVAFLYHTSGATRYIYMLCTVLYLLCMYWYHILVGRHKIIYIQSGCKVIGQDICQESLKKGELMRLMLNLQVLGKCLARSLNNPTVHTLER